MSRQEAIEEYAKALKLGQKEYKDRQSKGKDPNPLVLTELIGSFAAEQQAGQTFFPGAVRAAAPFDCCLQAPAFGFQELLFSPRPAVSRSSVRSPEK